MPKIIFFTSSAGDSDLAVETIKKLDNSEIILAPLSEVAANKAALFIEQIGDNPRIKVSINEAILNKPILSIEELDAIKEMVDINNIDRAYIGVPSPNNEQKAFQIANAINVPLTIAYEFMFDAPEQHPFWENINSLVEKKADFAIPLKNAQNKIKQINADAKTHSIGHLSIDRALSKEIFSNDVAQTRETLSLGEDEKLLVISSTTQAIQVDNEFFSALLEAMAKPEHENIKLFVSIHPGIHNLADYLSTILKTCGLYPQLASRFKIILNGNDLKKLSNNLDVIQNDYILLANLTGAKLGDAADGIAQAVPGALPNEAAVRGKAAYYHERSNPSYLPNQLFAATIHGFFTEQKAHPSILLAELEIEGTAPDNLATILKH